jgi:hypothetical protein
MWRQRRYIEFDDLNIEYKDNGTDEHAGCHIIEDDDYKFSRAATTVIFGYDYHDDYYLEHFHACCRVVVFVVARTCR